MVNFESLFRETKGKPIQYKGKELRLFDAITKQFISNDTICARDEPVEPWALILRPGKDERFGLRQCDYTYELLSMLEKGANHFKLVFDKTESEWKQGVMLSCKGFFEIKGQKVKKIIVLWQVTAPREVEFVVQSDGDEMDKATVFL
jgi:hypothetical protein